MLEMQCLVFQLELYGIVYRFPNLKGKGKVEIQCILNEIRPERIWYKFNYNWTKIKKVIFVSIFLDFCLRTRPSRIFMRLYDVMKPSMHNQY